MGEIDEGGIETEGGVDREGDRSALEVGVCICTERVFAYTFCPYQHNTYALYIYMVRKIPYHYMSMGSRLRRLCAGVRLCSLLEKLVIALLRHTRTHVMVSTRTLSWLAQYIQQTGTLVAWALFKDSCPRTPSPRPLYTLKGKLPLGIDAAASSNQLQMDLF